MRSLVELHRSSATPPSPHVETYAHPYDALPKIDDTIDLLIVDLEMPGMDGKKFVDYARQKGVPAQRIVVTSSHSADELHERFRIGETIAVINKTEAQPAGGVPDDPRLGDAAMSAECECRGDELMTSRSRARPAPRTRTLIIRAVTVQAPAAPAEQAPSFTLNDLLVYMAKQQASDLHLKPMRPPLMRMRGKLVPVKSDPLKPADLEKMLLPLLNRAQKEKFEAHAVGRLRLRRAGRGALPREPLHAARHGRRGLPPHPDPDHADDRRSSSCRTPSAT